MKETPEEVRGWCVERLDIPGSAYEKLKAANLDTITQVKTTMIGSGAEAAERLAAYCKMSRKEAETVQRSVERLLGIQGTADAAMEREKATLDSVLKSTAAWITLDAAADVLGCSGATLRRQIKKDRKALGFPVIEIGDSFKIPRQPFAEYMIHGGIETNTFQPGPESCYTASIKFGRYPVTGGISVDVHGSEMETMQLITDGVLELIARTNGICAVREVSKALCSLILSKAEMMSGYAELKTKWVPEEPAREEVSA